MGIGTPSTHSRMYPTLPSCRDGRVGKLGSFMRRLLGEMRSCFIFALSPACALRDGSDSAVGRRRGTSVHHQAAVHVEHLSGNESRKRCHEKAHRMSELLGLA